MSVCCLGHPASDIFVTAARADQDRPMADLNPDEIRGFQTQYSCDVETGTDLLFFGKATFNSLSLYLVFFIWKVKDLTGPQAGSENNSPSFQGPDCLQTASQSLLCPELFFIAQHGVGT